MDRRIRIGNQTSLAAPTADAAQLTVKNNLGFLRQCISGIEHIEFFDADSEKSYLAICSGQFEVVDRQLFMHKLGDQTLREILNELAPDLVDT